MKVILIAALCHAANAAYCASLGDDSQVAWDAAPEWQKESAIKGVQFCLANPDAPPSANHDSWMAEKVKAGWVYGEVKDPAATPPTHPCIVPFDQLPREQQFKDVLFKTIVAGCAADGDVIDTSNWDPAFVDGLTAERDQALQRALAAETERDAATAKAEKAASAAKAAVTRGEKSTNPRKLGPVDNALTGDALSDAIAAADANGKKVEMVLSDGKREIAGIAPIAVTGDVWREHTLGKMLKDPVVVHGPAMGETGFTIDGYALLIDGKQVAYCKRSDVINIAPGGQASIADDIYF